MSILTTLRALTVSLQPELKITEELHFPKNFSPHNEIAWDVTYSTPVKFLFPNYETRKIDEYIPVPETVGKPLKRYDAEAEKEKREEEIEMAMEDEWDERIENEKKIVPVGTEDIKAVSELMKTYLKNIINGEPEKCIPLLDDDFVFDRSYNKEFFIENQIPEYKEAAKEHESGELKLVSAKEQYYTDEDKSTLKVLFSLEFQSDSGELVSDECPVWFKRHNDSWKIYGIDQE